MIYQDDTLYQKADFAAQIAALEGERILLSNENYIGQSLYYQHSNRTRIAQRLHEAMPQATIILVLRNQIDILKSLYLISVNSHEEKTLEDFVYLPREGYTHAMHQAGDRSDYKTYQYYNTFDAHEHVDSYLYGPLIELYKRLFPRVEILLYEDLKARPEVVIDRLESIFEVELPPVAKQAFQPGNKVNSSPGKRQANLLRKANRWHHVAANNRFFFGLYNRYKRYVQHKVKSSDKLDFSPEMRQQLTDFYREHNQALAQALPEVDFSPYRSKYLLD